MWVGECLVADMGHVLGQEAFYEIGGNLGHFRWGNSLGHTMRQRVKMVV